MAVIQRTYTRGGVEKNLALGVDTEGISNYKAETILPEEPYDLPLREAPVRILLEFDDKQLSGNLVKITTWRGRGFVSPNGVVIENTIEIKDFLSKEQDLKDFAKMYGDGILRSVANGIVEILDGFEGQKLFDPQTGADLPDPTPEPA